MRNILSDKIIIECAESISKSKKSENKFFKAFLHFSLVFILFNQIELSALKGGLFDSVMTWVFLFFIISTILMYYDCKRAILKDSERLVGRYIHLIYKDEDYGSQRVMRNILFFALDENISVHELCRIYLRGVQKKHYLKSAKIIISMINEKHH